MRFGLVFDNVLWSKPLVSLMILGHFCTLATFKLSLCCTGLTKSKFSCTNRILRHAEFQICITLPHRRASEACRAQNSFIPTFSGHWSPDPSLGVGRGNLTMCVPTYQYGRTHVTIENTYLIIVIFFYTDTIFGE